ncbi:MAG TPA: hypothetical protein VMF90_21775 [Rhizobiaceae bacterium]|nr:hypothetical protein [Rhizobiaceae bacterium]
MRRFFALLMVLAMVSGSFGPAFADRPGGDSPCTPETIEQCGGIDATAIIQPSTDKGSCGLKEIGVLGHCPVHELRISRIAVTYAERALLPAFLAQPERPPKQT